MSPITDYLRSSSILFSHTPSYDDKGRQLPFDESPPQRRERRAFVKSLQWQRNVATWMDNQHHSTSNSHSSSPSTSSSESSSPRTPASPLNTPHTHTPQQHKQALDAELAKLALATAAVAPPQNRQSRNYKNLHLANTNTTHTPLYQTSARSQPRAQIHGRGIFDSSSYTYPSMPSRTDEEDQLLGSGEPYIFYSSTTPKRPLSTLPTTSTTTTTPAGIGEFPCPTPSLSLTSPIASPLQSPSSSSSPRTLTLPTSNPVATTNW